MNEYIDDENTVQNSLVGIAVQYMDQDWQLVRHFLGNDLLSQARTCGRTPRKSGEVHGRVGYPRGVRRGDGT